MVDTSTLQTPDTIAHRGWRQSLKAFLHPRVLTMLFLGFSAGVPILLIFSSMSLWLREAGVEKSAVTFFSWAALGYSFKFVWAPLVDRLPLPWLTRRLGRRRGWLLLAQLAVIASILWMALTDPAAGSGALTTMALAAVALGFSSATQDIVIDAYRIESAGNELQALMSSSYIAGYRIGMLVAGAGALYLAGWFGSVGEAGGYLYAAWAKTYAIMAGVMLIGILTTLWVPEPSHYRAQEEDHSTQDHVRFVLLFVVAVLVFVLMFRLSGGMIGAVKEQITAASHNKALGGLIGEALRLGLSVSAAGLVAWLLVRAGLANRAMVYQAYVAPIVDFFSRHGVRLAVLLLLVVGFYRVSDIVLGVIANVFYQDMGYDKSQIATASKVYGLWMTILGSFLGGLLSVRFGVMRILFLGAVLSAATNLLFVLLAGSEPDMGLLILVISADNLSGGLATAAFIAFLSSLTNVQFTAVQYAIFSSLMTLFPKVLGGYSGSMVETMGYSSFFMMTAVLTLPVLLLLWLAGRYFDPERANQTG